MYWIENTAVARLRSTSSGCLWCQPFVHPPFLTLVQQRSIDCFALLKRLTEPDAIVQTVCLSLPKFDRFRAYHIAAPVRQGHFRVRSELLFDGLFLFIQKLPARYRLALRAGQGTDLAGARPLMEIGFRRFARYTLGRTLDANGPSQW
uniref:Uncharacterized protein n=1 Tax=Anopheles coluzzii TaxID=1518534 RepID=A0A8W7Q3F8_ANOCL